MARRPRTQQPPQPSTDDYLRRLSPAAARSYLEAYRRADLPVPLPEHQLAIVRARAGQLAAA